jgi:hypothetical protein
LGLSGSWVVRTVSLGAGQDVEVEVAAAFGPFVVLFGQDGADAGGSGRCGRGGCR